MCDRWISDRGGWALTGMCQRPALPSPDTRVASIKGSSLDRSVLHGSQAFIPLPAVGRGIPNARSRRPNSLRNFGANRC